MSEEMNSSSGASVQTSPDGLTEAQHSAGWVRATESLPAYERRVLVLTSMGRVFKAYLADGNAETDEGPCDQWVADEEDICPPCWSDGACWSSNADEEPSDQPVAWAPLPAESGAQSPSDAGASAGNPVEDELQKALSRLAEVEGAVTEWAKVAKDFEEFDGDRRGIADALHCREVTLAALVGVELEEWDD